MTSSKGIMCIAALALIAFVCHAAVGADSDDDRTATNAVTVGANGDDSASIPDFDGDGTIGFGDFVIFAGVFGARRGEEKYDATHDLNGDGEIGFSDFVVFAQNFGKDAPSPAVAIPDANLRAAIEAALDKANGVPITQAEMATLDSLVAPNFTNEPGIRELTGLEYARNLTTLILWQNAIEDISVVEGLTNLTELSLNGNNLSDSDLSALTGLTNLVHLGLAVNSITEISALAGLTNLKWLTLARNKITDISVLAGLTKLEDLYLADNSITDISALAGLTNLRNLWLYRNNIADISPVAGFTELRELVFSDTNIPDISTLAGLTNLEALQLIRCKITDISQLAGLTKLKLLNLKSNDIKDISAVAGLTNLIILNLFANSIADISVLTGLTNLASLDLRGNPLNDASKKEHLPALLGNVSTLYYDTVFPLGDFDIELVFLDSFTGNHKKVLEYVARRWMAVIVEDLPGYEFTQGWSGRCGGQSFNIPSGERIDDLRIYVSTFKGGGILGHGGPSLLREESHLPVVGCMAFDLSHANLLITGLHEIGHVLGFVSDVWNELGFYQNPLNGDTHFNGPLATAAFDNAGGRDYKNAKVPLQKDESHWRGGVFGDELMTPTGTGALSTITVQSLADLGYGVDVTQADAYNLPGAAGKAVAKIAVSAPSILGDDRTGRFEDAERIWGRGVTFDLPDNQRTWGEGSPAHAEPELTCGAGRMNEPIYVIDPQGRVVRTIDR